MELWTKRLRFANKEEVEITRLSERHIRKLPNLTCSAARYANDARHAKKAKSLRDDFDEEQITRAAEEFNGRANLKVTHFSAQDVQLHKVAWGAFLFTVSEWRITLSRNLWQNKLGRPGAHDTNLRSRWSVIRKRLEGRRK